MRFQSPVWVSVLSTWQGFLQILCLPNKPGYKLRLGRVFPSTLTTQSTRGAGTISAQTAASPDVLITGVLCLNPHRGLPDSSLSFHHPHPPGVLSRGHGEGMQVLWARASREADGARMGPESSNPELSSSFTTHVPLRVQVLLPPLPSLSPWCSLYHVFQKPRALETAQCVSPPSTGGHFSSSTGSGPSHKCPQCLTVRETKPVLALEPSWHLPTAWN